METGARKLLLTGILNILLYYLIVISCHKFFNPRCQQSPKRHVTIVSSKENPPQLRSLSS